MRIIDLTQGSDEWKLFRRSHMGASDIGILMAGTKGEIYDLYLSKVVGKEKYKTDAMQRGLDMEEEARNWFNDKFKPMVAVHDQHEWLMASFDGIDLEKNEILEIKCPKVVSENLQKHENYCKWWWQVQAQYAVSNAQKAFLLAYSPSTQSWSAIDRDEDAIARLIEAGEGFWRRVINYDPPQAEIEERFDLDALDVTSDWKRAKDALRAAELAESEAREKVIEVALDKPFSCNGVTVQKVQRPGNVDYKSIPELTGVDLNKYRKPASEFWRIA